MPARHCARSARLVTSARSALPRCPLGTALPRSEVVQDEPTYGSLTGKKTGGRGTGLSHMTCKKRASCSCHAKKQAVRVMQKTSCSTCHEKTARKTVRKTCKLFVSCKKQAVPHVMQKPCKNHATCAYAGVYTGQVARQGGFYAGRRGNPPNIHSPRVPCYMCYMCYISQGKPLNIHSPRVPCYMCYMCYISQGKPLNIHSPRVPCYMCYMCYMV